MHKVDVRLVKRIKSGFDRRIPCENCKQKFRHSRKYLIARRTCLGRVLRQWFAKSPLQRRDVPSGRPANLHPKHFAGERLYRDDPKVKSALLTAGQSRASDHQAGCGRRTFISVQSLSARRRHVHGLTRVRYSGRGRCRQHVHPRALDRSAQTYAPPFPAECLHQCWRRKVRRNR